MAVFEYTGLNQSGKKVSGTVDADSIRGARQRLRAQQIYPTDLREGSEQSLKSSDRDVTKYFQSSRIKAKDLAVATRQLATLVGAGLPLVSALQALADQSDSIVLKRIILQTKDRVEEGSSLARAFAAFPDSFPSLYVNLIASGEESGTLDSVLENLADYLEAQLELRRKITSALFYPALMFGFCVLVVIGLLAFVVPSIVEIFRKQNAVLPLPTRILIAISNGLTSYWWALIALGVLVVVGLRSYAKSPAGKENLDRLVLRAPLLGSLYVKIATARVARTLGTLLTSGVGLLTALDIARNIVGNVHLSAALESAANGVREGKSLAGELSRSGLFPSLLSHMVAVGERSGRLEPMLLKAGKSYENEVNATISGLTSLIEPLMIISLGMVVFAIVISILMPMVNLIDIVQK